jgi:hypothetical protein
MTSDGTDTYTPINSTSEDEPTGKQKVRLSRGLDEFLVEQQFLL